ncbi:MAG: hypothetical protein JW769_04750 [Parachlamydiales bacterium]|nr:hypothetical protein [Parachlamydiales bacterium]
MKKVMLFIFVLFVSTATIGYAKEERKNLNIVKNSQSTREKKNNPSENNRKSQDAINNKSNHCFYEPGQSMSLGGNDW